MRGEMGGGGPGGGGGLLGDKWTADTSFAIYKKDWNLTNILHLSAADIEKSIDYRKFGKQWKEQISESLWRI